jgi:hypothetical protein
MDLFLFGYLCVPFVLYACVMRLRMSRWRALASALGAEYVAGRWLGLGRIVGEHFEISLEKIGKGLFTKICMRAGSDPGVFHLRREFFGDGSNWSFAKVPGTTKQRAFAWEITLPGYVDPSPEERDRLARFLPKSLSGIDRALEDARIRDVTIASGVVSAHLNGVVSSSTRLERALDALRAIASR